MEHNEICELEEAVQRIAAAVSSFPAASETERLPLFQALGRYAAEDYAAVYDQPPYPRAAMDGYAVHAADLVGASGEQPVQLPVIVSLYAGDDGQRVRLLPGTAVRIMTGAPLPCGADAVVRQEDTELCKENGSIDLNTGVSGTDLVNAAGCGESEATGRTGDRATGRVCRCEVLSSIYGESAALTEAQAYVKFRTPAKIGENCIRQGEDYRAGTCLVHAGEKLRAEQIALLASMGHAEICVKRRLRAAVLSTGSELTEPGRALSPGNLYDLNRYAVAGILQECGEDVRDLGSLPDDAGQIAERIEAAFSEADLLVTTGGVSVGEKDLLPEVLERLSAKLLFSGLCMKPGMPTKAAVRDGKLLLCLSGNPAAAYTQMQLLGKAALLLLHGIPFLGWERQRAVLMTPVSKKSPRRRFLQAVHRDGKVYVPSDNYSTGSFAGFAHCSCLIDIPAGSGELAAGTELQILPIDRENAGPIGSSGLAEPVRAAGVADVGAAVVGIVSAAARDFADVTDTAGAGETADTIGIADRTFQKQGETNRGKRTPLLFAVSGYKNTGKTTLINALLPLLLERGLQVACIKHDGHDFVPDVPGTDSYSYRENGAYGVAVFSEKRFSVTKEVNREGGDTGAGLFFGTRSSTLHTQKTAETAGVPELSEPIDQTKQAERTALALASLFPEADVILLEGFKHSSYPKYICRYPEEAPDSEAALVEILSLLQERA